MRDSKKEEQRLEALLMEGLRGEEHEVTGKAWSEIRREALEQLKLRRRSR